MNWTPTRININLERLIVPPTRNNMNLERWIAPPRELNCIFVGNKMVCVRCSPSQILGRGKMPGITFGILVFTSVLASVSLELIRVFPKFIFACCQILQSDSFSLGWRAEGTIVVVDAVRKYRKGWTDRVRLVSGSNTWHRDKPACCRMPMRY